MQYMFYVWLAVLVVTLIVEAATAGITSIWFSGGAVVALILYFCKMPIWVQVVGFLVISLCLLFFVRPVLSRSFNNHSEKMNVDALPDEVGIVTETIEPIQGKGQVKVKGLVWSARPENDDDIIMAGTYIVVVRVEGVKLIVRPR